MYLFIPALTNCKMLFTFLQHMSEGMDGRRAHTLRITQEILQDQKDAKILDAGAGTGIVGQMVRNIKNFCVHDPD